MSMITYMLTFKPIFSLKFILKNFVVSQKWIKGRFLYTLQDVSGRAGAHIQFH